MELLNDIITLEDNNTEVNKLTDSELLSTVIQINLSANEYKENILAYEELRSIKEDTFEDFKIKFSINNDINFESLKVKQSELSNRFKVELENIADKQLERLEKLSPTLEKMRLDLKTKFGNVKENTTFKDFKNAPEVSGLFRGGVFQHYLDTFNNVEQHYKVTDDKYKKLAEEIIANYKSNFNEEVKWLDKKVKRRGIQFESIDNYIIPFTIAAGKLYRVYKNNGEIVDTEICVIEYVAQKLKIHPTKHTTLKDISFELQTVKTFLDIPLSKQISLYKEKTKFIREKWGDYQMLDPTDDTYTKEDDINYHGIEGVFPLLIDNYVVELLSIYNRLNTILDSLDMD